MMGLMGVWPITPDHLDTCRSTGVRAALHTVVHPRPLAGERPAQTEHTAARGASRAVLHITLSEYDNEPHGHVLA